MSNCVTIIIPALNPGADFPSYCAALRKSTRAPILIVDDGSRADCAEIFDACTKSGDHISVIRHDVNRGKGRALKTAFAKLLKDPSVIGCVTCDSDGQHTPADVVRCIDELEANPEAFILGCRTFNLEHVPWKSRFGNTTMCTLFKLVTGRAITDTQTGLRAIPAGFMRELLDCPGERFEYETNMLLRIGERPLIQLPIETVYIDGNRETHFDPFKDSAKITAILLRHGIVRFGMFIIASLLSFGVDIGLFSLLYRVILPDTLKGRLLIAVVAARMVSIVFNYCCNRFVVFADGYRTGDRHFGKKEFGKYLLLAAGILCASYLFTALAGKLFPSVKIEILKACVDLLLFLASYSVQRLMIFRS